MTCEYLSPRGVADLLGIGDVHIVLAWIHAGKLPAVNLSSGRRATWRINRDDLDLFLAGRRTAPKATAPRRRRKMANVTEYF